MPPLVYLIRHGQTNWNAEERLQGQADTELNAQGRAEADRNGRRLAEFVEDPAAFDFVASPLHRTVETMERVRTHMGMPPEGYHTDPRLLEVHFGSWQGRTYDELEAASPGSTAARSRDKWGFVPPGAGAESYAMLAVRVSAWLEDLRRPTICVTHGGVIRVILHLAAGMTPADAVVLDIPQDRVLRIRDGGFEWL